MVNEKYPRPSNRFILQALDIASAFLAALPLIPSSLPAGKYPPIGKTDCEFIARKGRSDLSDNLVSDFLVSSGHLIFRALIGRIDARCSPMEKHFPMENLAVPGSGLGSFYELNVNTAKANNVISFNFNFYFRDARRARRPPE
jgi:hypothetical protein